MQLSNAKQKLQNKPRITKGNINFIKNKSKQYKKMCQTKDRTRQTTTSKKYNNNFKLIKTTNLN